MNAILTWAACILFVLFALTVYSLCRAWLAIGALERQVRSLQQPYTAIGHALMNAATTSEARAILNISDDRRPA